MLIFYLAWALGFFLRLQIQSDARCLAERATASSQLTSPTPALSFSYFLLIARFPGKQPPPPPPQASLGLIHANLGVEGGDGGGEDLPEAPQFVLCPHRALQAAVTGFGVVFATEARLPRFAPLLARLCLSRGAARRGGRMQGWGGGREKGTNSHSALQSGMRRMHKQLLCSRRCWHLSPTAPQTRTPDTTSEGSSASP